MAWLITSRLSPFSSSLLRSSPPSLPTLPTLAELQKHAEDAKSAVVSSLPSLPKYESPTVSTKQPSRAVPISHSVRQPFRAWNSPPPSYSVNDPVDTGVGETGVKGKKLSKCKLGWNRVQSRIPGEEYVRKMQRQGYEGSSERYQQVQIGEEEADAKKKTWWEWFTCR
ncbi:hypothetical protein DB88DRAFT_491380 [Papiliotrema laurentii]|uniref:Uncharacterized protein n=1 Tax=Papiliotrema laurentii TaxID=5418 RepID=A0AAD9CWS1_PAPLA|nr:hypothetical protein DB88DRAFT_491380 [Papiliotrema laurentii]